jgi:hypothetical protein
MNVLLKHAKCIFEWSGRYRLFTKHVAKIPTKGEILSIAPIGMNKIQQNRMQTIPDEYIERGIFEQSLSSWNAPAFLIKKRHCPNETNASKIWQVVKDYHQLNTTK